MAYAALSLIAAIVARLPRTARARLGRAIGWIAGSLLRIRRSHVESAMVRAGVRHPSASAVEMYRSLGQGLVELLWLAACEDDQREHAIAQVNIDERSVAALDEACAGGPVILFASHTGNWELAAAAAAKLLARRGKKLAVVAKAIHARGVHAFLTKLRARCGVELVAPRGALTAARRFLDAGDVLVMPIDQVPDLASHGMTLPFLGTPAVTDRAPATLAWRARATVLVVVADRVGDEHHVCVVETIAAPVAGDAPRAWIERTTLRATSRLDSFVRRSPASWMWLHRRWRAPLDRRATVEGAPRPPLVAPGKAG